MVAIIVLSPCLEMLFVVVVWLRGSYWWLNVALVGIYFFSL